MTSSALILARCGHRRWVARDAPMDAVARAAEKDKPCPECMVERAADLWRNVNLLDPGLDKGAAYSANERTMKKQRAIADHYTAYGVRLTLIELGLAPPDASLVEQPDPGASA